MRLTQFRIEGLGHLSTLIADELARVAAVVDPRRDVDIYLETAANDGVRISHVVETHLHNDYVSGGRDLAALTGATHVIGAGAELRYEHQPLNDGSGFDVGAIRFRTLDTPGHTPEHVAYDVADTTRSDEPFLLLTGGSLLVGAVGRTDLLGEANAHPYAAAMHHSLHDVLLPHEDSVMVYPTHGAGSLCSTDIAGTSWSTIGFERRYDPLLRIADVDAFAQALLEGQPAFPRYFARMRPMNQAGPPPLGGVVPTIPARPVAEVAALVADDAVIVDARSPGRHLRARPVGAISIPADESFGTWLGWVLDGDQPIVLVIDERVDLDDVARQTLRIGFEPFAGYIDGGVEAWEAAGQPVARGGGIDLETLARSLEGPAEDRPLVIDVRQAAEYADAHIPGSIHIGAGSLADRLAELPHDRPIATICASGHRASIGASILRARGFDRTVRVADGVPAWERAGYPVERGA